LPGAALGSFSLITAMQGDEFLSWHSDRGQWVTLAAHTVDAQLIKLVSPSLPRPKLTVRERECLIWLASGLRYDRIAERLGISLATVELHVANARRKLGARTREQAVAIAVALRLLDF
jgi:DNA-binding CsgD family transcriptional regulator